MQIILHWLLNAVAILIAAYLLPGVDVDGFIPALIAAVALAVVNALLKPALVVLTLPITIVTLGLFLLVINALLVMLVSAVVPGFVVDGFLSALLFSIVLSILNSVLHQLESKD